MSNTLRLIFLDIDGVLVTCKSHQEFKESGRLKVDEIFYDEWVANALSEFCEKYNFKIIISSTWKLHQDRLQLLLERAFNLDRFLLFPTLKESCTEHLRWYDSNMALDKLMHNDKFYEQLMEFVPFTRSLEIMKYLTKNIGHKPGEDYVIIIDDDSFDVNYWRNKLNTLVIKTDTYMGLDKNNLEEMKQFAKELK